MVKGAVATDWRAERRRSARSTIVAAAWSLVEEAGLASVSMRDLAKRAGITTPTLYAYFDSKNAVFDEMFAQSAEQFDAHMSAPYDAGDSRKLLSTMAQRFVEFCLSDVGRYQLLFQRTIPDFEPSARSYAYAEAALENTRRQLAAIGVSKDGQIDLLTALVTGLVDQQLSNDPGGDRWTKLLDDAIEMFASYCERTSRPRTLQPRSGQRTTEQRKQATRRNSRRGTPQRGRRA